MADATFCPYCERWLDEGPLRRILSHRRRPAMAVAHPTRTRMLERTLLVAGLVVAGLVAAACIVAAIFIV
jgi:hypothetical protein